MTKILFICSGNICRSPMAEFVMKDIVKKAGCEKDFVIRSAATSAEQLGCPVYPDAKRKLRENGIDCSSKVAAKLSRDDYNRYDLLVCMDSDNVRNTLRIVREDPKGKVKKLLDYCKGGDVADPWYTGDFELAFDDIVRGCTALFNSLH